VTARVKDFRASLEGEVLGACAEGMRPDAQPGVWARCEVPFASRTFFSVVCVGYADNAGAHPSKHSMAMNFELPAVREVLLKDLFATDADWRAAVERFVDVAFAHEMDEEGAASPSLEPGEPDAFVVTPEGLRFYFEDTLPFVVGSVHPLVRWDQLRPYLRHDPRGTWPPP
jgi:hypothetical protein